MKPATLKPFLRKEAWSVHALTEVGVPLATAHAWRVAETAPPAKARYSAKGRKRTAPTRDYIWGPDLAFLASPR